MSVWKKMMKKDSQDGRSSRLLSNSSRTKYTPKKQSNQKANKSFQVISLEAHSKSFNSGWAEYQTLDEKHKIKLMNESIIEVKDRKGSFSNIFQKSNILVMDETCPKVSQMKSLDEYQRQIMKIKEQFRKFQEVILLELKKQEQMIQQYVDQIFKYSNNVKEEVKTRVKCVRSPSLGAEIDKKQNSVIQLTKQSKMVNNKENLKSSSIRSQRSHSRDKTERLQKYQFSRFFEALNKLKEDAQTNEPEQSKREENKIHYPCQSSNCSLFDISPLSKSKINKYDPTKIFA